MNVRLKLWPDGWYIVLLRLRIKYGMKPIAVSSHDKQLYFLTAEKYQWLAIGVKYNVGGENQAEIH